LKIFGERERKTNKWYQFFTNIFHVWVFSLLSFVFLFIWLIRDIRVQIRFSCIWDFIQSRCSIRMNIHFFFLNFLNDNV
jgi:hypothetical protein